MIIMIIIIKYRGAQNRC